MSKYLNCTALQKGFIPCETNPDTGGLSRTLEPFHAIAVLTVGSQRGNFRHVCADCAASFHRSQKQRGGVLWQ